MTKNLVTLREAISDPRCPFTSERQLYNARAAAAPKIDSSGRVVDPGDPELLSCFIRLNGRGMGPLVLDLARMAEVMESRRLGQIDHERAA